MKRVIAIALAGYLVASSAFAQSMNANTNLTPNMDAIVRADSGGWMFNRYDAGSMRNVRVLQSSPDGSNAVVYGEYTYNGGARGWVKVRITNGALDCLEFWDFSGRCRPLGRSPSRDIVAGLVVGVAALAVVGAASGGSGGGYASNSQGRAQTPYPDDRQPAYTPPPPPPPPPPRTYGLYGNCPQPGAGYGC